jgi:hypothetical protein
MVFLLEYSIVESHNKFDALLTLQKKNVRLAESSN